jgi:hypothetical protein
MKDSRKAPDVTMEGNAEHSKRCKTTDTTTSPLNAALFTEAETARLRSSFADAQPYTHVVIRDLCEPDVLIAARNELIHNVEAKFKETDLFKVRAHTLTTSIRRTLDSTLVRMCSLVRAVACHQCTCTMMCREHVHKLALVRNEGLSEAPSLDMQRHIW